MSITRAIEIGRRIPGLREQVEAAKAKMESIKAQAPANSIKERLTAWITGERPQVPSSAWQDRLLGDLLTKRKKAEDKKIWSPNVGAELVKRALQQQPDYRVPAELLSKEEREHRARLRTAQMELDSATERLSDAERNYAWAKESVRSEIERSASERSWRWSFTNRPPVLTDVPETANIATQRGRREAPADILLAIAHGLATGSHWWLVSPADRKRSGWTLPAPADLSEIEAVHEAVAADEQFPPRVRFSASTFEWVQCDGGELDSNYGRKVTIRVKPGASTGTIQWNTGKWVEQGDEWTCSSFIASILVVLPNPKDDGTIARMIEADDQAVARRTAAIFAAKAAGVTGAIVDPETGRDIASGIEVCREEQFHLHLGYQPRRSWTVAGEKKRIARWLKRDEFRQLVANTTPLPWKMAE